MIGTNKEQYRLAATKRYLKLDLNSEQKLDALAMLASTITQTPVAFITLLDKEIQWMRSCHGYQVDQMPVETSFCKHTIQQDEIFEVSDTFENPQFSHYPVLHTNPAARFYAGTPLKSYDGYNVGTLCVMDIQPKELSDEQKKCLMALSKQVATIMELDLGKSLLEETVTQLEIKNKVVQENNLKLREIAQIQAHEFRGPLCSVISIMNLIKSEDYQVSKEYMEMMEEAVNNLDHKICSAVKVANRIVV